MCLQTQRHGNGARPATDIHNPPRTQFQGSLDHQFRLRPRNQNIRRDAEFAPIEFLAPSNVLCRLTVQAFVQIAAVMDPLDFAQLTLAMRIEERALAMQRMGKKYLRRQSWSRDASLLQQLRALEQRLLEGHRAPLSRYAFLL